MINFAQRDSQRKAVTERLDNSIESLQNWAFVEGASAARREANMTLATFKANVNNVKLSDFEFRQFMRNCLT